MESEWCIQTGGRLESFSEQQLVDCVTDCDGCNGGEAYKAFTYYMTHNAMTESSYGYNARAGYCQYNAENNSGVHTTNYGYMRVPPQSPDDMKTAL